MLLRRFNVLLRGKFLALYCSFLALTMAATPASERHLAGEIVAAHNAVRERVNVPPLRWSDRLSAQAQEWANHLVREHAFYHRPHPVFGENIYEIIGRGASPDEVVSDWASEARDYSYRSNTCRNVCGHYTQIVWSDTREVGCGVARDASREVWVCNYNPPGNYVGERPY